MAFQGIRVESFLYKLSSNPNGEIKIIFSSEKREAHFLWPNLIHENYLQELKIFKLLSYCTKHVAMFNEIIKKKFDINWRSPRNLELNYSPFNSHGLHLDGSNGVLSKHAKLIPEGSLDITISLHPDSGGWGYPNVVMGRARIPAFFLSPRASAAQLSST